jgi:hypothetical protein
MGRCYALAGAGRDGFACSRRPVKETRPERQFVLLIPTMLAVAVIELVSRFTARETAQ